MNLVRVRFVLCRSRSIAEVTAVVANLHKLPIIPKGLH